VRSSSAAAEQSRDPAGQDREGGRFSIDATSRSAEQSFLELALQHENGSTVHHRPELYRQLHSLGGGVRGAAATAQYFDQPHHGGGCPVVRGANRGIA